MHRACRESKARACAVCVLDLDSVIVDGSFGRELLDVLLTETERALGLYS